ncbi:Protein of unknown function [Weissella confusa LBAE C39-2]|nr:Protein of unknown function [Weissella confusa LBAE C39-2]
MESRFMYAAIVKL